MKKTFKFFAVALAIVAAASCAKEVSVDTPVDEKVPVTFTASYDAEDVTKAVLATDRFVHWSDDDAIRVYIYDNSGYFKNVSTLSIDPSSNDDDPTFAAFTGSLTYNSNYSYYAVTPSSGWNDLSMNYDSGLAVQNAVKNSFDPANHIAVADKAKKNTYDHFTFHNACALLKVTLAADNVYSVKVEGTNSNGVGIGGKLRFYTSDISAKTYVIGSMSDGTASHITLANSNSAALENGASYYIVVPHITVKNFKVSLCDANGNTLVTKSKTSDFKIERNKIYDLGTFELPKESLEVSTSSLSLAAKNGSASFKVVADVNWTVTSSASWLTVSPSSGTSTSGTTVNVVASENTDIQTRTATLTIRGKDLARTISVTQEKAKSYRYVKQLSHATELQDGKLYVIAYMKDSKMFWTEQDMWVKHKYFSSNYLSDNQYLANEVFKFHKVSVSTSIGKYNTTVVGMWESMSNGKYMSSNPAMNSTSNDASYISIGQWDGSSKDFDMYIGTSDANTLYYDGTKVAKGSIGTAESNNRGQKARKWYIYEVQER